jgi:hypothetical protein
MLKSYGPASSMNSCDQVPSRDVVPLSPPRPTGVSGAGASPSTDGNTASANSGQKTVLALQQDAAQDDQEVAAGTMRVPTEGAGMLRWER